MSVTATSRGAFNWEDCTAMYCKRRQHTVSACKDPRALLKPVTERGRGRGRERERERERSETQAQRCSYGFTGNFEVGQGHCERELILSHLIRFTVTAPKCNGCIILDI